MSDFTKVQRAVEQKLKDELTKVKNKLIHNKSEMNHI